LSNELSRAVLDASVLVQTVVREKYTDVALKLVSTLKTIYVPSLASYEIGNALVILACRNFLTKKDAIKKFRSISSIPTLNIREIALDRAIDTAIELETTLYDATYLALAIEADAPLVTADLELYEKGKKAAKVVHAAEVA